MVNVSPLSNREQHIAECIHAVTSLAYAQESELLGVTDFPPLDRNVGYYQASSDFYLGACLNGKIVGVLSVAPDDEGFGICITSLVVLPNVQRRGIGRALLRGAIARGAGSDFTVSTAARNLPALKLYGQCGFVQYKQGTVGLANLPMVKLRRAA